MLKRAPLIFVSIACVNTAIAGLQEKSALQRFEFREPHMGTEFRIVLYAQNAVVAREAAERAFMRIAQLDAGFSDYKSDSELMALCRRPGEWVKVSDDLFRCLERAKRFSGLTGGAFDVTVGPVSRLWRRARRTGEMPQPGELARALALIGYRKLNVDPASHSVRIALPGMLLDLGGIAKGYAADQALAVLRSHGLNRALVAAGGDILAGDSPPDANGWTIGIRSADPSRAREVVITNSAISTSGDSEQYVEIAGVRYSHIVDPRTGLGVKGRSSATVIAPHSTTADALATAICVLGPQGVKLIDSLNGVAALFVRADGDRIQSIESKRWRRITRPRRQGEDIHSGDLTVKRRL